MKRFSKIISAMAIFLFLGSCEDNILETEQRHSLSNEDAAKTVKGAQAILEGAVTELKGIFSAYRISVYRQCGTDIVRSGTHLGDEPSSGMKGMNTYDGNFSAESEHILDIWDRNYSGIVFANQIIGALVDIPIDELNDDAKDNLGQAYTMRAYLYLELVRRFANIPIVEVVDLDVDGPQFETEQKPKAEVYAQIISDLSNALPLIRTRSEATTVTTDDLFRPTRGLALILLAEANLDIGNNEDAASAAEELIVDASYILQPLGDIFGLAGSTQTNNELIFSIGFDPDVPDQTQFTSQQFVPLYDRVNGVARHMDNGGRPWSRLSPSAYYWTLFEEEDGRLEAWHRLRWTFDDAENLPDGVTVGDTVTIAHLQEQWPTEGREWRYLEPTTTKTWEDATLGRSVDIADGWRNIIMYRFAHAYISGAEAYFKLGNTAKAIELLNVLRERAYGDTSGNFNSLTFEDIVQEQARELGHEGHRWSFLVRNNLLVERVGMHNDDAKDNVQEKHTKWPIPLSFIDQTGSQQNPGY